MLGKTGSSGSVCIRRSELNFSEQQYLLFQSEGFFRGAFSVQRDLEGFDERVIALARVLLF